MNIGLLHRLRSAEGDFVPLEALGADVGLVRKELAELEGFGFALEHHPYRGVAYRGPAWRLCPDQIEHELGTVHIGRRITVWNRVGSTNDLAARAASSTANEGLVIMAEEQTAGRGSRGRVWTAPPSTSLLISFLLFPPARLAETGWLTALGAVATAEVVAKWTGQAAQIKWPNDVRVSGRKIAGILVERNLGAVVGIGLNVNLAASDLPLDLQTTATSIRILANGTVDRSEVARDLIRRMDHWYGLGLESGPETLNRPWRDRSEHLGRLVRANTTDGTFEGRLEDLDLLVGATLDSPSGPIRLPGERILSLAVKDDALAGQAPDAVAPPA
ncbi:biotin--[acetyl-CoA-carboxylase] ligase [Singulisphaera sp. PoT]|uniref:biotin--[acetyl-CoA-carboxylase] ligase n=1 Tax=Singulisphaera sp. PoT TaxID=3411797 RepID=UPI003BF48B4C